MPTIAIDHLTPGETGLSLEAVCRHRSSLERGESLEPIHVFILGSCHLVRDGNSRVRAFIEHHAAIGTELPEIAFAVSTREIGPTPLLALKKMAVYHRAGREPFLKLPVAATDAEYVEMQG